MSIPINEIKPGLTVEMDKNILRCLEYHHQRAAQQSWIRIKFKNLRTGAIFERTFKPGEKVEPARIDFTPMQFLYNDSEGYHFMNQATFEQIAVPAKKMADTAKYLKEGFVANISFYGEEIIDIELPGSVELKITDTAPQFKGDTVSGTKPAEVETGAVIQVPFFLNPGDVIKVDTRDGKYLGRA
jgi:elongation factor P